MLTVLKGYLRTETLTLHTTDSKHRHNGFDLIRHIAAISVIFGHAYPLTGRSGPGYLANGVQTIAVKVFFVTSGFLITKSWLNDPSLARYFSKRGLRILPGLAVVILLSALLLGPAFTTLPLIEYFRNANTWRYLLNLVLYPVYALPGVFATNTYPNAVNGSLWTIPVECFMYVLTPIILRHGGTSSKVAITITTLMAAILAISISSAGPAAFPKVVYGTSLASLLEVAVYFQIGALYGIFALERFSRPVLSLLLIALPCCLFYNQVSGELLLLLLLPFAVISVGNLHIAAVDNVLRGQDLSYGLYLYAFPIQQAVQSLSHNRLSPQGNFALSLIASMLFAYLSWNLIERHALALKPRGMRKPVPALT